MLQTSSNQRDSHRLSRASVTNVVNLSLKTTIFSEKALGLTTFVTTGQKATRKTPWIDDVCNNTQRSAPKSQHDKPDHIGGPENPAAVPMDGGWAWPAFETTRRATRQHTRPHRCGGRRRVRRARAGCKTRGLAGLRGDAPSQPSAHQASLVWRAPEGPEGTGGLRGAAPNEVRPPSLAGGRALRRPEHQRGNKQQATHTKTPTRNRVGVSEPPVGIEPTTYSLRVNRSAD